MTVYLMRVLRPESRVENLSPSAATPYRLLMNVSDFFMIEYLKDYFHLSQMKVRMHVLCLKHIFVKHVPLLIFTTSITTAGEDTFKLS